MTIRYDGDEGLLQACEEIEFLSPIYGGDFIEITRKIVVGKTSRKMKFEAYKVISPSKDSKIESACDVLDLPILVAKATDTSVAIQEKQRKRN